MLQIPENTDASLTVFFWFELPTTLEIPIFSLRFFFNLAFMDPFPSHLFPMTLDGVGMDIFWNYIK